tara:strand:- start:38267 stop:38707 length:441 start_codon:yes stop_codon:yes gene_type:complete
MTNDLTKSAKYRPSLTADELKVISQALEPYCATNETANSAYKVVQMQLVKINMGAVKPAYVNTGPRATQTDLIRQELLGPEASASQAKAITGQDLDYSSPEVQYSSWQIVELAAVSGMAVSQADYNAAKEYAEFHGYEMPQVNIRA